MNAGRGHFGSRLTRVGGHVIRTTASPSKCTRAASGTIEILLLRPGAAQGQAPAPPADRVHARDRRSQAGPAQRARGRVTCATGYTRLAPPCRRPARSSKTSRRSFSLPSAAPHRGLRRLGVAVIGPETTADGRSCRVQGSDAPGPRRRRSGLPASCFTAAMGLPAARSTAALAPPRISFAGGDVRAASTFRFGRALLFHVVPILLTSTSERATEDLWNNEEQRHVEGLHSLKVAGPRPPRLGRELPAPSSQRLPREARPENAPWSRHYRRGRG